MFTTPYKILFPQKPSLSLFSWSRSNQLKTTFKMFLFLVCCLLAITQAIEQPLELYYVDEENYNTVTQVSDHTRPCDANSAGTLRYRSNKMQYCDGTKYVNLAVATAELGSEENPATSCSEVLQYNSDAKSGVYYLKSGDKTFKVYCHMDSICGAKGWTLLLKMDGSKQTFKYDSAYWTSKNVLNQDAASEGLNTNTEVKLPTYSSFPFSKLCLGMRVGSSTRWLAVPKKASSLYSVISTNKYQATKLGRNAWKSLISGSSLQRNCNREGFNIQLHNKARIGIVSNQEIDCITPDSYLGFGVKPKIGCGLNRSITVGNGAGCTRFYPDNGNKNTIAMGFVLAQ